MSVYLERVRAAINPFPIASLADTMLDGLNRNNLLKNPSRDTSFDSAVQIVSRFVVSYFIYPRVSPIAALINGSLGVVHLTAGLTSRSQTETPENTTAGNIHKGLVHLMTAGYDFGIGFLLTRQYSGLAGVIAFSTFPVLAFSLHQKIFKKLEETPIAKTETTVPSTPSTTLDKTCRVYIFAQRITSELMPRKDPETPENIVRRVLKITKRILGVSSEKPLPNFGL